MLVAAVGLVGLVLVVATVVVVVALAGEPDAVALTAESAVAPPVAELLDAASRAQISAIRGAFSDPSSRPIMTATPSATDLLANPATYAGRRVTLVGQVTRWTLVYDGDPDWPRVYLLVLDSALPVVFAGGGSVISAGDTVQVVGVLSQSGEGILADTVIRAQAGIQALVSQPKTSLRLALAD